MADRTFAATLDAVADAMRAKAELPFDRAFLLALLGGAYIALAAFGSTVAACDLTASGATYGLGRCLSGLLFPAGLMLVVLAGGELFTGNCLMTEALRRRTVSLPAMLRSWGLVYLGNFIGAVIVAALLHASGLFLSGGGKVAAAVIRTAAAKASLAPAEAFVLGIFCNWLVCLAVWLAGRTDTLAHKALLLFFPIWLFVASGYEHSVANMYYLFAGLFASSSPEVLAASALPDALASAVAVPGILSNLFFVSLGNIVGGSLFVGGACAVAFRSGK